MKFKYFFSFSFPRCVFEKTSNKITFFQLIMFWYLFLFEALHEIRVLFFGEKRWCWFGVPIAAVVGIFREALFYIFNGGLTFQTVMRFIEFILSQSSLISNFSKKVINCFILELTLFFCIFLRIHGTSLSFMHESLWSLKAP